MNLLVTICPSVQTAQRDIFHLCTVTSFVSSDVYSPVKTWKTWGICMAPSVACLTPGFGSGQDLRFVLRVPHRVPCSVGSQVEVLSLCPSPHLCTGPLSRLRSLSQINLKVRHEKCGTPGWLSQ